MSTVNRCCLNCAYLKSGLCGLFEIVPKPADKMYCANFTPKVNIISEVTEAEKIVKQTVFEHITANEEALAEKMVFLKAVVCSFNAKDNTHYIEQWISTICNDVYPSKHEAFVATVEELKKEWKK